MKRKSFFVGILIVFILSLITGVVWAESRNHGSIFAETYVSGSDVKSRTYGTYTHYYLRVFLRAWGSAPNPLKDSAGDYCYNCLSTNANNVHVWNGYIGYKTAKHLGMHEGNGSSPMWTTYTSSTGYSSSYTCYEGGC